MGGTALDTPFETSNPVQGCLVKVLAPLSAQLPADTPGGSTKGAEKGVFKGHVGNVCDDGNIN